MHIEADMTVLFNIHKEGPNLEDKTTECVGIFHEEEEKKVMVIFDELDESLTIDIEAGNTAVAARFDFEQAVELRQRLDEEIDRMAKA